MFEFFLGTEELFYYLFCFRLHKVVDSEHTPDIYKALKISIREKIENYEILRFVLIALRLKKYVKFN